jgi:predicted nucleic-acid-binding Zn-ribbon protein
MTMKDGLCPLCGSTEVYRPKPSSFTVTKRNTIKISVVHTATTTDYVCIDCGYTENYVEDHSALRKIGEHWERADGKPNEKRKNDE